MFSGKKILVGVTGGIAAYKACQIVRDLKKMNALVRVVMTDAATKFVTPLTFSTLSDSKVLTTLFDNERDSTTIHIEAARWADCVLVCPATANTINKVANGIADNLLTTLIMAANVPVVFCPAMNMEMYKNQIYRQHVEKLKKGGYIFIESETGSLACGEYGAGRLADQEVIVQELKNILLKGNKLEGKKVLISAGRTEEPIDPVRFISNRATGKMGFALAEAALAEGAQVTLVSGPTQLVAANGIKYISVRTSAEMAEKIKAEFEDQDIVVMAAAVADYSPKNYSGQKIKKNAESISIELVKTQDILKTLARKKEKRILVGFAVETENEMQNARQKLAEKSLDLIVLNNPAVPGAGFEVDTNIVTIIDAAGNQEQLPKMSKRAVADEVMKRIVRFVNK